MAESFRRASGGAKRDFLVALPPRCCSLHTVAIFLPSPPLSLCLFAFHQLYSFTNLSFIQVVPLACMDNRFNYYHGMAIQCAFPLALTVLLKLLSMVPGSAISFRFWTLVMLSALLPSVSLSLFRFFSEYETADGTKWLTADLSIQTRDEEGNFQDQRGQWAVFVYCMVSRPRVQSSISELYYTKRILTLIRTHSEFNTKPLSSISRSSSTRSAVRICLHTQAL